MTSAATRPVVARPATASRPGRIASAVVLAAALVLPALAPMPLLAQPAGAPSSFADLAERLSPAVVNISTAQTVDRPGADALPQVPPGSPFEELFRDFFENGRPGTRPRRVQSLGSGFVISKEGYVVTNNHVIENADEIEVQFTDGTSLKAELVGTDPKTDIALLRVKPVKPLPAVPFGDSEKARVGDWVLAIGNPLGFGGSVSAGIISARNRDIRSGPYDDFIQTDAAINRGNSGGPLFNLAGEVIGVNTAIVSPTGGSIGIGFSVPSNLVANVVQQLQEYGETRRGWLGVRIQEVTDEIAQTLGLAEVRGALVADVTEGGPAAEAGLIRRDVILSFDGRDVGAMRDLPRMVAETPVGKSVRVTVFREGKTRTFKVTLGRLEDQEVATGPDAGETPKADEPKPENVPSIGLSVSPLSPALRERFEIEDSATGLLIVDVDPAGPASANGLRAGMVIVEVGSTPVATAAELREKLDALKAEGKSLALLLVQSGRDIRLAPVKILD